MVTRSSSPTSSAHCKHMSDGESYFAFLLQFCWERIVPVHNSVKVEFICDTRGWTRKPQAEKPREQMILLRRSPWLLVLKQSDRKCIGLFLWQDGEERGALFLLVILVALRIIWFSWKDNYWFVFCNQMLENMILGSRTFTERNVAGATTHGPVLVNLNSMYVLQCLQQIQYCNPINRKFKSSKAAPT
jgi:hypothetical protein